MRGIINNIINFYQMRAEAMDVLLANTQKALEQSENQRKADEQVQRMENFVRDLTMNLNNMLAKFYFLRDRKNRKQEQMTDGQVKAITGFAVFVKTLTQNVRSLLRRFQDGYTFEEKIDEEIREIETCVGQKLKKFDGALDEPLCRLGTGGDFVIDWVARTKRILLKSFEYKKTQEAKKQYALEPLNKELRRFIDTLGEIPYVALPSEKPDIICFCAKVKKLCGYDADDILADRQLWGGMIHPDDCERVFAAFAKCRNKGVPFNIGYRIIHKDDSVRYVNDKGWPVFDDKGEITQIEGTITPLREVTKTKNVPLLEFGKATMSNNVNSNCFQKV